MSAESVAFYAADADNVVAAILGGIVLRQCEQECGGCLGGRRRLTEIGAAPCVGGRAQREVKGYPLAKRSVASGRRLRMQS